jgi:tripartite-type tricarboxylate transporter receptor subunit TctC
MTAAGGGAASPADETEGNCNRSAVMFCFAVNSGQPDGCSEATGARGIAIEIGRRMVRCQCSAGASQKSKIGGDAMASIRRGLAVAALVALVHAAPSWAQDYPTRTITMIAPWAAGGAVDTVARIAAPKLSERVGKPVVVENRPGGGSTIGTAAAAKAAPDGYTLGMPGSGSMAISPAMYKSLPYDPLKDIQPVALIGRVPFVLIVSPSLPVQTVPELIKYAKENRITYASGGPGSPHHLYAEMFQGMTGIKMTHIPYKGSAHAINDVVAGHVPVLFSDPAPSIPLIKSGKVRALGVTTLARWSVAPDIPTLNEAGVPGFDAAGWFMVAVPAGTPKPIVDRLHAEFRTIMGLPDVEQAVNRLGIVGVVSPSLDELSRFVKSELERWGKVVQQAGLAGTL